MAEDLTNLQFGKLTVIKRGDNDKSGHVRWWCKCDCGNPKLILVAAGHLKSGHTQSCGCIRRDNIKPQKNLEGKRFGKLIVKEFLGIKIIDHYGVVIVIVVRKLTLYHRL